MDEIERQAEALLERVPDYVWDKRSLPVPVEDVADSVFGLLVVDAEVMSLAPGAPKLAEGTSFSGLLLPATKEIWVNAHEAQEWPGRRRFTIGHELGHWCMHRGEHQPSVFCRSVEETPEEKPERPLSEREADAFAAALLMPAGLMRAQYKRCRDERADLFPEMCELFGASARAMGRRLQSVI